MKTQNLRKSLAAVAMAVLVLWASNINAQSAAAPQLSYGVAEIAQLAQAKVGDSTIIAYIKSANVSYGLDANQIVYLRQQGVSDAVITTMLNQPKTVAAPATVPMPTTPAPQVATTASTAPVSTATVAPTVTYVQTVPTTTYYYAQPYYYPSYYYGGWAPNVSLSFGFGRYYGGHGGYYGGWHGGYGGGWHGGHH